MGQTIGDNPHCGLVLETSKKYNININKIVSESINYSV